MAGMVVINVIGVLSGIMGIVQFGKDNFGSTDSKGSTVRIQVGLDSDRGLSNSGGDLPDVRLFNEGGEFLGLHVDPGSIEDGTASDIKVEQSAEQQAMYGLFTANNNAICIAYISIVWPDDQKYGWVGDIGKKCDAHWYHSNIVLAGMKDKPACMWIDANKDHPVTAFQVHFPDFASPNGTVEHDESFYCDGGSAFKLYYDEDPKSITFWIPNEAERKSKRALITNRVKAPQHQRRDGTVYSNDSRLVISSDVGQSAVELCESVGSLGPDFLNTAEGLFCHMSTKTIYPVCTGALRENCFNKDTKKLILGGIATRDVDYPKVIDWTLG